MDMALRERFLRKKRGSGGYLRIFLISFGLAAIVFLPFMLVNEGYFLYYGDFNVQQVPFYRLCHDAILSGNYKWSHITDLGANFIGSYTFYTLGSPFFWISLLFPSSVVPYLMGPLFMLKFACASLTSYLFIRRYTRTQRAAEIGAILYAFSGYSIYNVFFNHFHEAMVFFPLLLWALDAYMYERRRGVFALAVFACCFVNYYFFVGQVAFTLIYWFVGMVSRRWEISLRDVALLFLEAVIGVLLSCVLLVPSIFAVLQNPRVSNSFDGWNAILYNVNQRYMHIIECFFFPPDIPARPNFTPDSQSKWASLGAWLPLFSMSGVIAFLRIKKSHWLKKLLVIFFIMALVPILNSAFQLFNSSYYARWYYMLTLLMSLATVKALESHQVNFKKAIGITTAITAAITLLIGLMPTKSKDLKDIHGNPLTVFGLEQYPTRFWSYVAISLFCLCLFSFLVFYFRKNRRQFMRIVSVALAFVSVIYSIFVIAVGKTQSADPREHIIPYALNGGKDVDLPDLDVCRVDFYESLDNSAMFWQVPSIQAFHSIVPGSIMDFYPSIGVTRDVGSRADTTHYGLRALTSVHWLFDDDSDRNYFDGDNHDKPAMPGWKYYDNQNGFDVWENENYIPMGFWYHNYVTPEEYEAVDKKKRELLLLRAMVMTDEQAAKYPGVISHYEGSKNAVYDEGTYYTDVSVLRKNVCESFGYDNDGFTAKITTDQSRLVFFSVPFEPGWSAKVNGTPVQIEKVSVGFMAVCVPEGESEIRFDYSTPGLSIGVVISLCALLLLGIYLLCVKILKVDAEYEPPRRRTLRTLSEYEAKTGKTFGAVAENENDPDPDEGGSDPVDASPETVKKKDQNDETPAAGAAAEPQEKEAQEDERNQTRAGDTLL